MALNYDTVTLPTTELVPVWLDDVMCNGTETALSACPHSMWGENDCSPNTAAGVNCSGMKYGPTLASVPRPSPLCAILHVLIVQGKERTQLHATGKARG